MSIDRKINRIQFLTGNSLKFIAVLTMVIDHLCKIVLQWLLSNYWGSMVDNEQMSWERFQEIDNLILSIESSASCGASFSVSRRKLLACECCVTSFRQGGYTPLHR